MSSRPTLIERAFELARSGRCPNVKDIERVLLMEGFARFELGPALQGRSMRGELGALCKAARGALQQETSSTRA